LALSGRDYLQHEWGEDIYKIAESMARTLWHIERYTGNRWALDDQTFDEFQRATASILRAYRDLVQVNRRDPVSGRHLPDLSPDERADVFAALGGVSPPRLLSEKQFDSEVEAARRAESLRSWMKLIEKRNSRPLPAPAEKSKGRKS
jgi:hypothetical protein